MTEPYASDLGRHRWVRPRIRSGPVNRPLTGAGLLGWLAWQTWPGPGSSGFGLGLFATCALGAVVLALRGLGSLVTDYRLRRDLALAERVSTDHGTARQSTRAERAARGMADSASGELFGLDDHGVPVWRPAGAPFALIEMPPGVGKTVCLVMGSILHRAKLGVSVVVPDVKEELAVMLAPWLRRLGYEVWVINPARHHLASVGAIEINPYQPLLDAIYGEGEARKDALKLAADYAALHHPMTSAEKNPYFAQGSRRAIITGLLILALFDPAACTPTGLYLLLTDPVRLLELCRRMQSFETLIPDDPVLAVAQVEARNLLHRAKENEENFASFLEGASQKLIAFNPAGHLGHYGSGAIHSLAAMRERQVIVCVMTPLSHLREFADFISLVNHTIVAACKAKPDGHPVHFVAEEALNYRFTNLVSDLETLRQLRVTADFYIQSFAGLERQYGREAAAAIESYADIRVYAGLNAYDRAKRLSEMLAQATTRRQEVSYRSTLTDLGLASREMGRSLMRPDEVLAMAPGTAWMFVRGLRPVRLHLVSYAEVVPWSGWVDPSPITGTRLHAATRVHVDYPDTGGRDAGA